MFWYVHHLYHRQKKIQYVNSPKIKWNFKNETKTEEFFAWLLNKISNVIFNPVCSAYLCKNPDHRNQQYITWNNFITFY